MKQRKDYSLTRDLQSSGFFVGNKDNSQWITAVTDVIEVESREELQELHKWIESGNRFGHSLYINGMNADNEDFKRLIAIHLVRNEDNKVVTNTYCLQNVIPRKCFPKDFWISGLFIGDRSIEEKWDFNNCDDQYFGGIVDIQSNFEIPFEVSEEKRKTTVGIFLNVGARAILKTQKEPFVSVLLQSQAFVWIEAKVQLRTDFDTKVVPIEDLLRDQFKFESNAVPLLFLNSNPNHIDWGIQIKDDVEGHRVVCIEGPKEWNKYLTIQEWNHNNIETYLYRRNVEPIWTKPNSTDIQRKAAIKRSIELKEWLTTDPNTLQLLGTVRQMPTKQYKRLEEVLIYCVKSRKSIQMMVRLEKSKIEGIDPISKTGPVIALTAYQPIDSFAFGLLQSRLYGTYLFVVTDPNEEIEEIKLKALICCQNYCKTFELNDVLWRELEKDIWIKGLLIGGIDIIRKKWRNRRTLKKKESVGTSAPKVKKPKKQRKSRKNRFVRIEECEEPKLEFPKIHEFWDNCLEIQSNFVIPNTSYDLPFGGQVIGLYIPSGVRCVLINGVIDRQMYSEVHSQHQVFHKRKCNPILLQEKSFLWIEGWVEFNLLDDPNIAYQPLEHSLLKHLVLENRVIGDTEEIELSPHLYRHVLTLQPIPNTDIVWSIEVSPLIYPVFEHRVLTINIPTGGQILIQNWDKAFEQTISSEHTFPFGPQSVKIEPNIGLRKWIQTDFKPRIYGFIKRCVELEIFKEIPSSYRRNALKTRKSLENRDKHYVRNFGNVFFIFDHFHDKSVYWCVINYKNLYLDHSGLIKLFKDKLSLFESEYKQVFYDQLI